MSTVKVKSKQELIDTLKEQGFVVDDPWYLDPNSCRAFHRSMLGLAGRRLIVDEKTKPYYDTVGYDFTDSNYKFAWMKEWLSRI